MIYITIFQLLEVLSIIRKALKIEIFIKRYQKSKIRLLDSIKVFQRLNKVKIVDIEVSIVNKILPYIVVDSSISLNIIQV